MADRNLEYEEQIRSIVKTYPKNFVRMLKSKGVHKNKSEDRRHLWNYVLEKTKFLDVVKTNDATRVYFCLNHITEIPECARPGCHNKMSKVIAVSLEDPSLKQPKYCSKACNRKAAQANFVKRCQEKYGENIRNVFQVQAVKDSIMKTNIKNLGVAHPLQNRTIWLKTRKKYVYDGIKFDSSWEIVYYEYLKQHGIVFEYQPKASFVYSANGTTHNYYPDFFLPEKNVYVELKDERTIEKYLNCRGRPLNKAETAMLEKMQLLQKLVDEGKVLLLTSVEMKPYFTWFREKFGMRYKEYLRRFRNK